MAILTKTELQEQLVGLTDNTKRMGFVGGLYIKVLKGATNGLYFSAFRTFLCDVFPAIALDGKFGLYSPMLSSVINGAHANEWIDFEERKNKAKFHVIKKEDAITQLLESLNDKFGEEFVAFLESAKACYDNENGGGNSYSKESAEFFSFYK